MPRRQKKYHYIYRTTCLITGKFYVGMHSTDDLEDGYLGSGKILGYSRAKHGDENHVKEILEHLPSRDLLAIREREIVNETLLANTLNINLRYGGEGGFETINEKRQNVYGSNGKPGHGGENLLRGEELKTLLISRGEWEDHKDKISRAVKKRIKDSGHWWEGRKHSAEAVSNMKIAAIGKQVGEKNSQYGTCWVCNQEGAKKIKQTDLGDYLEKGFHQGSK